MWQDKNKNSTRQFEDMTMRLVPYGSRSWEKQMAEKKERASLNGPAASSDTRLTKSE